LPTNKLLYGFYLPDPSGCVASPPPSPLHQFFEQMADLCDRFLGDESIMFGDLNCPGTESTLVDDRLSDVI